MLLHKYVPAWRSQLTLTAMSSAIITAATMGLVAHAQCGSPAPAPVSTPSPTLSPHLPTSSQPLTVPFNMVPTDVTDRPLSGFFTMERASGQQSPALVGIRRCSNEEFQTDDNFQGPTDGILLYFATGSAWQQNNLHSATLNQGSALVAVKKPAQKALLHTPLGDVSLSQGASALVNCSDGVMRIKALDSHGDCVKIALFRQDPTTERDPQAQREVLALAPGYELLVADRSLVKSDLLPKDGIGRRYCTVIDKGNRAVSELSLESVLMHEKVLQEMQCDPSARKDRNLLDKVSKRAAVLAYLRGTQNYISNAEQGAAVTGSTAKNDTLSARVKSRLDDDCNMAPGSQYGLIGFFHPNNVSGKDSNSSASSTNRTLPTKPNPTAPREVATTSSSGSWINQPLIFCRPTNENDPGKSAAGNADTSKPNREVATTSSSGSWINQPLIFCRPTDEKDPGKSAAGNADTSKPNAKMPKQSIDENGNVVTELPDGTKVSTNKNGDLVVEYPKGSDLPDNANGSRVTRYKNGDMLIEYPNGKKEFKRADGTVVVIEPNGDTIVQYPGCGPTTRKPDGTIVDEEKGGKKTTTYPNGDKTIQLGDKTITIKKDGTIITETNDKKITDEPGGKTATEWPNGKKEVSEPNGKKITTLPNGDTVIKLGGGSDKTITIKQDGTLITETNDKKITNKTDGSTVTEYPDGTREVVEKNGTNTTIFPNGEKIVQGPGAKK